MGLLSLHRSTHIVSSLDDPDHPFHTYNFKKWLFELNSIRYFESKMWVLKLITSHSFVDSQVSGFQSHMWVLQEMKKKKKKSYMWVLKLINPTLNVLSSRVTGI